LLQRRLHSLAFEAEPRIIFRGIRCPRLDALAERLRTPPVLAAHEIDSPTVHERQQPGARLAALWHEAVGVPPSREETFLHCILCELLVPKDPESKSVRHSAEPVVELGERRLVRARKERDDRLVGKVRKASSHWPSSLVHRRYS
jgi:hypothetical protein